MNQSTLPALPKEWVERLFERLAMMYGAKFLDQWANVDNAMLKRAWAEDLAGYTPDELRRGLDACKTRTFPPTLPELMQLCRPVLSAEKAYYEAVSQMALRPSGEDVWSHPAVFWTARKISEFDLRNSSWSAIKGRWTQAFEACMAAGIWPEIPAAMKQLAAPGKQDVPIEKSQQRIKALASGLMDSHQQRPGKGWARKIIEDEKAGKTVSYLKLRFAQEAIRAS